MTNKKMFWLGILVMVLVFGMAVIGCDNDPDNNDNGNGNGGGIDPALNGTWIKGTHNGIWNNGNFEHHIINSGEFLFKGVYTTNGNVYTRTVTHYGKGMISTLDTLKWYSKNDLQTLEVFNEKLTPFDTLTGIYTVNGNILTLTFDANDPEKWTRE